MKCLTIPEKMMEIGGAFEKMTLFPLCPYTSTRPLSNLEHCLCMKFMFLEMARPGKLCVRLLTSLL